MTGEVVYLYAFDVANEIITAKVQEVLSNKPVPFAIRDDHTFPKNVMRYRPLAIEPTPLSGRLNGQTVRLQIRIYDIGVVSIAMRVAFETANLKDLLPFHNPKLNDGKPLDDVAGDLCKQVCESLKDAMVRAASFSVPEAYTVFCLTEIDGTEDVNQWLTDERRAIAGLLAETAPDKLSDAQVNEVLRLQRTYEKTDLAVIDWDAALVVDLNGYVDDTLFVLELANLQLEEFQVMDQILDRYLNKAYEDLERRPFSLFGTSSKVLRALRQHRVDLTKLADEVAHITKFFGDWYLARVYLAARERFYLDTWRASVEQRLGQLDQLYSVVQSEVNERRMLWLEVIIVVFFAIDLLAIFFYKK